MSLITYGGTAYDLDLDALDILHALVSVTGPLDLEYVQNQEAVSRLSEMGLISHVGFRAWTATGRGRDVHRTWRDAQ